MGVTIDADSCLDILDYLEVQDFEECSSEEITQTVDQLFKGLERGQFVDRKEPCMCVLRRLIYQRPEFTCNVLNSFMYHMEDFMKLGGKFIKFAVVARDSIMRSGEAPSVYVAHLLARTLPFDVGRDNRRNMEFLEAMLNAHPECYLLHLRHQEIIRDHSRLEYTFKKGRELRQAIDEWRGERGLTTSTEIGRRDDLPNEFTQLAAFCESQGNIHDARRYMSMFYRSAAERSDSVTHLLNLMELERLCLADLMRAMAHGDDKTVSFLENILEETISRQLDKLFDAEETPSQQFWAGVLERRREAYGDCAGGPIILNESSTFHAEIAKIAETKR